MDLRDSTEEQAFREEARSWLSRHAAPHTRPPVSPSAIIAEWTPEEERQRLGEAKRWQATKFDAGWAGITWPRRYGGRDGTPIQQVIFDQEESRFAVPRDALIVGLGWCGPAVLALGTDEQKDRLLPRLLRGDDVWCQLFSEPDAGSDLASLSTRAVLDGDEWVITGTKVWATMAHLADLGLCIARHDPALRHQGLTAFIIEMDAAGVEARPIRQMTGSANFNQVHLDEVRVSDAMRVGEPGDGWKVVVATFMYERLSASMTIAPILGALRDLISDCGGQETPQVRDAFARVAAAERVLDLTRLRMATSLSEGRVPGPHGSITKLLLTQTLTSIYDLGIDALGADGMLTGADAPDGGSWQGALLGTPGLRIGGGTDEIQRDIIGDRILGLPRSPRS